jgi:hypothetical protein
MKIAAVNVTTKRADTGTAEEVVKTAFIAEK